MRRRCARLAGWLALAPVAFGYRGADRAGVSLHRAAWADWATAAALALVSLVTLACWVVAWRRRLRADGIVAPPSRRQARRETRAQRRREHDGDGAARTPDPAQVLSELRALLTPLLPNRPSHPYRPGQPSRPSQPSQPNGPGSTRTIGPERRRSRIPGPAAWRP